jgi:hypothetical protein
MRRLYVGLVVVLLVALALSVGVNIGLMLGTQHSEGPSPSPSPIPSAQPTEAPSPTPIPTAATTPPPQTTTITPQNITLNYGESSRHTNPDGTQTTVVLSVNLQHQGEAVTIDKNRFQLSIMTSRGGLEPYPIYLQSGIAYPAESGFVTVGGDHPQANFTLSFQFSTLQQTSMGGITSFHGYELRYV